MVKVILKADKADDLVLAFRAAQWLLRAPKDQKDGVIAYGSKEPTTDFYVRRTVNGSISVQPCYRA